MLELIQQLIDRGIALVREGKERRSVIFREIVQPIHVRFETLCSQHLNTFAEVREILRDERESLQRARDIVGRRRITEFSSWSALRSLEKLDQLSKGEVGKLFADYVHSIQKCLSQAADLQPPTPIDMVLYYNSLDNSLEKAISALFGIRSGSSSEKEIRINALNELGKLTTRFMAFQAEVEHAYVQLKSKCIV